MIVYDRRTLPKRRRDLPLKGSDTHQGKWFKCCNCGFPCFLDREKLDSNETGGKGFHIKEVTDVTYSPSALESGDMNTVRLLPSILKREFLAMKLDGEGDVIQVPQYKNYTQVVTQGCPHCGTLLWKA